MARIIETEKYGRIKLYSLGGNKRTIDLYGTSVYRKIWHDSDCRMWIEIYGEYVEVKTKDKYYLTAEPGCAKGQALRDEYGRLVKA